MFLVLLDREMVSQGVYLRRYTPVFALKSFRTKRIEKQVVLIFARDKEKTVRVVFLFDLYVT